jgi:hypothetical protein
MTKAEDEIRFAIAQLRHAYTHLINGTFEPKALATGLIAPEIRRLERLTTPTDDTRRPFTRADYDAAPEDGTRYREPRLALSIATRRSSWVAASSVSYGSSATRPAAPMRPQALTSTVCPRRSRSTDRL